jgi:SAM-dependent methyltransferase
MTATGDGAWAPNDSATAELYEEHPYPGDGFVRTTMARVLSIGLEQRRPGWTPATILDAGCGTGEAACGIARRYPKAKVVAIDVNPPSLRLARDLAARKAPNLTVVQADLGEGVRQTLADLDLLPAGGFDVVTSLGVLHHLPEPEVGFRSVREVISDDGLFLCYVYSRLGRWGDVAIRHLLDAAGADSVGARLELVRGLGLDRGFSSSSRLAFLSSLRRRVRLGPPLDLIAMVGVWRQRSSQTHVADHWANPVEHMYDFAQLAATLDETGWRFAGLARKGGLPVSAEEATEDPEELEHLRSLPPGALYDLLAYRYRVRGFTFFALPT